MSDRQVQWLAVAVVSGAWLAVPVSVWPALVGVAVALLARRPLLLVAMAAVLSGSLGATALAGLDAVETGPWEGTVTLVDDPARDDFGAVRAIARAGEHHVELVARGAAGVALEARLAGQTIATVGQLQPLGRSANWLRHRHVAARLGVEHLGSWSPGSPLYRVANAFRTRLDGGAASGLDGREASLLMGLTIGDDRKQSPGLTDAFRASGLTHLLAVSGQNVAFVLAIVGPLTARMGTRPRLACALSVLVLFAIVTRLEPSVLRATAMAAGAVLTRAWGREADGKRLLAVAVTLVVLGDPLIVRSAAFQLSVAATWGIIAWSGPVARSIPAPVWIREPIAVTVAAQLAVAPIQVALFDGLPIASLPANLLAGPAAGPAMVWGMTAGFVAGFLGDATASIVHLPSRILVGWIAGVAEWSSDLPWGVLRLPHLVVGGSALATLWVMRRVGAGDQALPRVLLRSRAVGRSVVALVVLHALVWGGLPRDRPMAEVWRLRQEGAAMVVVALPATGSTERLLDDLRRAEVRGIDVLLAARGSRAQSRMVLAVRDRHHVRLVLAPAHHEVVTARVPTVGSMVGFGPVGVEVQEVDPELVVAIVGER